MRSVYLFLIVVIALSACGTASINIATPQTEQTPSPISTEKIFALTKMGMLTGEAETETAVSPKNGATVTAIMATKYAMRTQYVETITAMPTQTPTPAIPNDSPLCTPTDLKANFSSTGGTGNLFLFVNFTNISNRPCYLQVLPQAKLVDAQDRALDVDYSYQDMNADQVASALTNKVGLFPQWQAWFTLIWFDSRTWCGAPIEGDLLIRITLMDNIGMIDVPTGINFGVARCDMPGSRTPVSITGFEVMLPSTATP